MGLKLPVLEEPAQLQTWTVLVTLILRQHGKHYFMIFSPNPEVLTKKDPDTYAALLRAIQPVFNLLLEDGSWNYNKGSLHELWRAIQTIIPKHIDTGGPGTGTDTGTGAGPKTTPLLNYMVHRGSVVLSSDSPYHVFNDARYFDKLETIHLAAPSPSSEAAAAAAAAGTASPVPMLGGIARFQACHSGGKTYDWSFQAIYDQDAPYSKVSLGQLHIGARYLDGATNSVKNKVGGATVAEIKWVNNVAVVQLAKSPLTEPAATAGASAAAAAAATEGGGSSSLARAGTEPPSYEQALDSKLDSKRG